MSQAYESSAAVAVRSMVVLDGLGLTSDANAPCPSFVNYYSFFSLYLLTKTRNIKNEFEFLITNFKLSTPLPSIYFLLSTSYAQVYIYKNAKPLNRNLNWLEIGEGAAMKMMMTI